MAKALVLTAALAGGMALASSLTNEVQASSFGLRYSGCRQFDGTPGGQCLFTYSPNCALPALCS